MTPGLKVNALSSLLVWLVWILPPLSHTALPLMKSQSEFGPINSVHNNLINLNISVSGNTLTIWHVANDDMALVTPCMLTPGMS